MAQKPSRKNARFQRLRHPIALPLLPEQNSFPFARSQPHLKWLSPAQLVRVVMSTPEWEQTVGKRCDELQASFSAMSLSRRAYTPRELEQVEVLRRILGHEDICETRNWLGGDLGSGARKLLGFDTPRDHIRNRFRPMQIGHNNDRRFDGVPSEATLLRHEKLMGCDETATAYEAAFELIVPAHLKEFPQMRAEARIQHTDGSGMRTHYTAPHYRKQPDGSLKLLNGHLVTAPEAGSTGNSKNADKNGDGWTIVTKGVVSGLAIAYAVTPWHHAENKTALEKVHEQYRRIVEPFLQLKPDELCVESADSALHSHEYRRTLKDSRIVENIHESSHGTSKTTQKSVARKDAERTPIEGTNWSVNGHHEPFCDCGDGHVSRRFAEENGRARKWTEGECDTCGPLSLTPGLWRVTKNPRRWVECQPGEEGNWAFGNPFTYHAKLSEHYGTARFAYQEGAHGVLEKGYALLKHKRWFRTQAEPRLEAAMVYFIQHALARWQRREAAKAAAGLPAGSVPASAASPAAQAPAALAAVANADGVAPASNPMSGRETA